MLPIVGFKNTFISYCRGRTIFLVIKFCSLWPLPSPGGKLSITFIATFMTQNDLLNCL